MQYRKSIHRAAVTVVAAAAAALLATGCQPGDGKAAAPASSDVPSAASSVPAEASASAVPAKETGSSGTAAAPTCAMNALKAEAHQAKQRPQGTGVGAAIVGFTNTSGRPCTLQGFPTVAGAANGAPGRNAPLAVTRTGSAAPVRLAPGGKAWVKLTFVPVQGEGDGSCASGAAPAAYPTLVLGLPGAGAHQVALDDGVFAECDNKVTTTALLAVSPS